MKIYIAHDNPYDAGNPYIYTLMDCISQYHSDVKWGWGVSEFWEKNIFSYDIIHFHWPQVFMASDNRRHSMSDFSNRIAELKKKGIRIIATCHDLTCHYRQCAEFSKSFDIVYGMADVIFHLGEYSKKLFERKYPNSNHCLLPHHTFDTVYKEFPLRKDALKRLKLNESNTYVLCLGMFRSEEERKLVIECAKKFKYRKTYFLAPAFMNVSKKYWFNFFPTISRLKQLYYKWKYHIICTGKTWVPITDDEIPFYYAVADVAFVHRLKILNSGNAILPMLFKKIVVGPDTGNVGEILKQWGYPVFDPEKPKLAYKAIEQGVNLARSNNLPFPKNGQNMLYSTLIVSNMLYEYYQNAIHIVHRIKNI